MLSLGRGFTGNMRDNFRELFKRINPITPNPISTPACFRIPLNANDPVAAGGARTATELPKPVVYEMLCSVSCCCCCCFVPPPVFCLYVFRIMRLPRKGRDLWSYKAGNHAEELEEILLGGGSQGWRPTDLQSHRGCLHPRDLRQTLHAQTMELC